MAPPILITPRLALRLFTPADAPFILELVNDPSWLRFIGDKKVRDLDGARHYIESGPMKMYAERGFGLWRVERKEDGESLGMCGLVKRDTLEDVDLGFAFLPRHWSKGYARESAEAVVDWARRSLGIARIVAVTSPDNAASSGLLKRLGFTYESTVHWPPKDPVDLYALGVTT